MVERLHPYPDSQEPTYDAMKIELDGCRHAVATIEANRTFSTTQNHNLSFYKGKVAGLEFAMAVMPQPASVAQAGKVPGFVKPDNDQQVFFYEQDFYVLSNFSAFNVKWGPYTLPTSEHLYHWRRFFLAGHSAADKMCDQIARAPSAHEAFKLAQANKVYQVERWDDMKVGEMRSILRAKAEQHEYVRRKLLATGDRELIEDSWRDSFWGWGPNRDGQNMLGKLWMEVRADLRASSVSSTQSRGEASS